MAKNERKNTSSPGGNVPTALIQDAMTMNTVTDAIFKLMPVSGLLSVTLASMSAVIIRATRARPSFLVEPLAIPDVGDGLPDPLRSCRHIDVLDAVSCVQCIGHGVHHSRGGTDRTRLAGTLDPKRIGG